MSMSRAFFSITVLFYAFVALTGQAAAELAGPHNAVNNIGCFNYCHILPEVKSPYWNHSPDDIDDTPTNHLCNSCHTLISGPYSMVNAPKVRTHSSKAIDNDYGDWTTECTDCHSPHYQEQLEWINSGEAGMFIATGSITSYSYTDYSTEGNVGETTLDYDTAISFKPGWDATKLTQKTINYRRAILIPDTTTLKPDTTDNLSYQVVAVDETFNTITVMGDASEILDTVALPSSFGIIYGQLIRQYIKNDNFLEPVKFFDNIAAGNGGFTDQSSITSPKGICQVCHTQTTHWSPDALAANDVHYPDQACTDCHNHASGFAHRGGNSGCEFCHDHDAIVTTPSFCQSADCHDDGVFTAHNVSTAPNANCNTCHETNNRYALTSDLLDVYLADNVNWISAKEKHMLATSEPACDDCHYGQYNEHIVDTATQHHALHDMALLGYDTNSDGVSDEVLSCAACHFNDVVYEHTTRRNINCSTCHESTELKVIEAISAGRAGSPVFCDDCHNIEDGAPADNLIANHHLTVYSTSGDCTRCHVVGPGARGPKKPPCFQCHGQGKPGDPQRAGNNKHTNGPAIPVVTVQELRDDKGIKDFRVCFSCHLDGGQGFQPGVTPPVVPMHALPTEDVHWPTGYYKDETNTWQKPEPLIPSNANPVMPLNFEAPEYSAEWLEYSGFGTLNYLAYQQRHSYLYKNATHITNYDIFNWANEQTTNSNGEDYWGPRYVVGQSDGVFMMRDYPNVPISYNGNFEIPSYDGSGYIGKPSGSGFLQVTIEPEAARTAGAQWRVDGGNWQASGTTISGVTDRDNHLVEFKPVANWAEPPSLLVAIADGQTTTISGPSSTYMSCEEDSRLSITRATGNDPMTIDWNLPEQEEVFEVSDYNPAGVSCEIWQDDAGNLVEAEGFIVTPSVDGASCLLTKDGITPVADNPYNLVLKATGSSCFRNSIEANLHITVKPAGEPSPKAMAGGKIGSPIDEQSLVNDGNYQFTRLKDNTFVRTHQSGNLSALVINDQGIIDSVSGEAALNAEQVVRLSDNVMAMVNHVPGDEYFVQAIHVDENSIVPFGTPYRFDWGHSDLGGASISPLNGNNNIFIISWRHYNTHYIITVHIDPESGAISEIDRDNFAGWYSSNTITHLSGEYYFMIYDSAFRVLQIKDDGTIRNEADGSLLNVPVDQPSGALGSMGNFVHLQGNIYAMVYSGMNGPGYLKTMEITIGGTVSLRLINTYMFDHGSPRNAIITKVSGNVIAIPYYRYGSSIRLYTFEITDDGRIILPLLDDLALVGSYLSDPPSLFQVDGEIFVFAVQSDESGTTPFTGIRTIEISIDNDGDGWQGRQDNCPDIANAGQLDSDDDGIGDVCDGCPYDADNDDDGDGICGDVDPCPDDFNDDRDNDTICDGTGSLSPKTGDQDNCKFIANASQANADGDSLGDACDVCPDDPDNDADGDSICGDQDAYPFDANNDIDGDIIGGELDNCPRVANADQADIDGDGQGDACDLCPNDALNDLDNDTICLGAGFRDAMTGDNDNCPTVANKNQVDTDIDGKGDACDYPLPDTPTNVTPAPAAVNLSFDPILLTATSLTGGSSSHIASQWQISTENGAAFDANKIYDSDPLTDSISHTPIILLKNNTTYYWRVRYQDSTTAWSLYSEETSFTNIPSPTGTAAYWLFDEGSGVTAHDIIGGHDGTLKNGLEQTWSNDSLSGMGLDFDGANDYITVPDAEGLQLSDTGSVSVWLRSDTSWEQDYYTCLVSKHNSRNTADMAYSLAWLNYNKIQGEISDGTVLQVINIPDWSDHNWHHLVFTWDGSFLRLYKDGVEAATPVAQTINTVQANTGIPLKIGGYGYGGAGGSSAYFEGVIDQAAVFNRALTFVEIAEMYEKNLGNTPPDKPVNTAPSANAIEENISTDLKTLPFSDSDGHSHQASRWQVRKATGTYGDADSYDSRAVADLITQNITLAESSTTYDWRVQHQDNVGAWSVWSNETGFTTDDDLDCNKQGDSSDPPSYYPPGSLTTTVQSDNNMTISWDDILRDGDGYRIERKAESCSADSMNFTPVSTISLSDDFESGIDLEAWNVWVMVQTDSTSIMSDQVNDASGTAEVSWESGAVKLHTTANDVDDTGYNSSSLGMNNLAGIMGAGDFDIQVDYFLPEGEISATQYHVYARLVVVLPQTDSKNNYLLVERYGNGGGGGYQATISADGDWKNGTVPTNDLSGKLRLVRKDRRLSGYFWNGSAWQLLYAHSKPLTADLVPTQTHIFQYARRNDASGQDLTVLIDNFRINTVGGMPVAVLQMDLDEDAWSGANAGVLDTTVDGNHGTAFGGASTVYDNERGMVGSFDGDDDYIEISGAGTLQNVTDTSFSFSVWAKPLSVPLGTDSDDIRYAIMSRPGQHLSLQYNGNKIFRMMGWDESGGKAIASSNSMYEPGYWHHLAGVVDDAAKTVSLYVDGEYQSTTNYTGGLWDYGTLPFYVGTGRPYDSYQWFFHGLIDDARIFDYALTATEVDSLFHNRMEFKDTSLAADTTYCYQVYPFKNNSCANWTNHAAEFEATTAASCSDTDSDGICDASDSCPDDVFNDADNDSLCAGSASQNPKTGHSDNCPFVANAAQEDVDANGVGDACYIIRPVNSTPVDLESPVHPIPTLIASAFSGGNGVHQASQWQISTGSGDDFAANIIYDSGPVTDLETHRIAAALTGETTYSWRLRFQDDLGYWSWYSLDTAFTTAATLPTGSAVAQWRFEEGSGDTVQDSIGNYDGTRVSATWNGVGRIGGGMDFDGINDSVVMPQVSGFDQFSAEFWLKPDYSNDGSRRTLVDFSDPLFRETWEVNDHQEIVECSGDVMYGDESIVTHYCGSVGYDSIQITDEFAHTGSQSLRARTIGQLNGCPISRAIIDLPKEVPVTSDLKFAAWVYSETTKGNIIRIGINDSGTMRYLHYSVHWGFSWHESNDNTAEVKYINLNNTPSSNWIEVSRNIYTDMVNNGIPYHGNETVASIEVQAYCGEPKFTVQDFYVDDFVLYRNNVQYKDSSIKLIRNDANDLSLVLKDTILPIPGSAITQGQWNHVVLALNNTTASFYVDGKAVLEDEPISFTFPTASSPILGANIVNGSFFNGSLDELILYNHKLSPAQVAGRIVAVGEVVYDSPPAMPANTAPTHGSIDTAITTTLSASISSDPDGHTHLASRWQLRTADGVYGDGDSYDSGTVADLTSHDLTIGNDAYYWHVQYQDSSGSWSSWSTETGFTRNVQP